MPTTKQIAKVVTVPTEKNSHIAINRDGKFIWSGIGFTNPNANYSNTVYVYFLSEDKPIVGDWVYHIEHGVVKNQNNTDDLTKHGYKKIIATNNPELNIEIEILAHPCEENDWLVEYQENILLPKPTTEFLQQWISANAPEYVNYESEFSVFERPFTRSENLIKPITSADNTLNFSLIEEEKESWGEIEKLWLTEKNPYSAADVFNWLQSNYHPPKQIEKQLKP